MSSAGWVLILLGAAQDVDFERRILPILSDNCFYCHGPDPKRRKGDLRLDLEKDARAALLPGKDGQNEFLRRVLAADPDEIMPPPKSNKTLTPEQIGLLKAWIAAGAPWGEHWAFQPLRKPEGTSIDAFLHARLKREGLRPSPEADRATLLRRVSLDLTGLPPTPRELEAGESYEQAVDRLLASPRYGERMAWDWMEAARYADSNGYQGDNERTMWPWRDWVVKAFNENLPYDRFTVWQLAGDLLPGATREQKLATAFSRNHPINGEGGRIAEENRVEYVMDMAETAGTVWLGLTFNCCRCHDHKFDPLRKADYYGLFAFFNQTPVNGGGGDPQTPPVLDLPTPEQSEAIARLDVEWDLACTETAEVETVLAAELAAEAKAKDLIKVEPRKRNRQQLDDLQKATAAAFPDYSKRIKALRDLAERRSNAAKAVVRVMVMEDQKTPRKSYQLDKGLYDKREGEIGASTPLKLPPLADDAPRNRLGLAEWLVRPDHPLTARVTVNRIWQQFFGIGLTKTAEDFGVQGEYPVHRELLDWLAADFRDSGWDLKRLIRKIVTSAAYKQSSRITPELLEKDPHNRLIARGPRFRLPSWMIRDQALAAAGLLVDKPGGPPVKPYQPPGIWEEATFGAKRYAPDKGEALYRRSLYVFWRRIVGPTMFFDTPSRSVCVVKPTRTNTPLQALALLNDTTYVEAARVLAEVALREGVDDDRRLDVVFRRVLARTPRDEERKILIESLGRRRADYAGRPEDARKLLAVGDSKRDLALAPAEHAAWTAVALMVLNLDEAVTKE